MGVSKAGNRVGFGVAVEVSVGKTVLIAMAVLVSVKIMAADVAVSMVCVGVVTGVGAVLVQDASSIMARR
jgi:hypothetical protein